MSKLDRAEFLASEVRNHLTNLHNPELHQVFNNVEIEIAACNAILNIFDETRNINGVGWNRVPFNSKRNLSQLVSTQINPVLSSMHSVTAKPIIQYLPYQINQNSTSIEIESFAEWMANFSAVNDSEKRALYYLSQALEMLAISFANIRARKLKINDKPYCAFCYRESRYGFDSCHQHEGTSRLYGKRYLERYRKLKKIILNHQLGRETIDSSKFFSLAIAKLESKSHNNWLTSPDKLKWIEETLLIFEVCTSKDVSSLSNRILKLSENDQPNWQIFWPSGLNGTMYRYQAYVLSKFNKPTEKVAKRLNLIWQNKPIKEVRKEAKGFHNAIKRAVTYWTSNIKQYRNENIPDELIKVSLGLTYLPPNNQGGAADKKSPQRF